MTENDNDSIVVMDFWSDKNRGDAAMQVALLEMLEERFPDADLSVMAAYGTNEFPEASEEFDITGEYPAEIFGGIQQTYFLQERGSGLERLLLMAKQISAVLIGFLFLAALAVLGPKRAQTLLNEDQRESYRRLHEADVVVWNGRNIRDRPLLTEPYFTFRLLFHPAVALLLERKVVCVGASIWHLNNPISIKMTNMVLNRLEYLTVREERSYIALRRTLNNRMDNVNVVPDLSFYTLEQLREETESGDGDGFTPDTEEDKPLIGITLMDWYGDGAENREEYVDSMSALIDHLIDSYDAEVVIIPQVTYDPEATGGVVTDVLDGTRNQDRISVLEGEPTMAELVQMYSELDFLVGTRMHSTIFALSVDTPVLAIAYDHGAKWGILEMLDQEAQIIDFPDVSEELLISEFDRSWSDREMLVETAKGNKKQCEENVQNHIPYIEQSLVGEK